MRLFGWFDGSSNDEIKHKQNIFKISLFVGIFIVVALAVIALDDSPKESVGDFKLYSEEKSIKTRWMSEAANELKLQKESMKQVERATKEAQSEVEKLRAELTKLKEERASYLSSQDEKKGSMKYPEPPHEIDLNSYLPPEMREVEEKQDPPHALLEDTPIKVVEREFIPSLGVESYASQEKSAPAELKKELLALLSTGTILQATLTNGMDAPTMSQAKDNPLIVHMILRDLAILPNRQKHDIKDCFVLGEGYGDLSSERAYIRANNISCITSKGHIDMPIKGYIAGEDGKIGLRGKVISKQGTLLARAIVAGFIDGVAKGFNDVGQTIQVTPFGTSSTQNLDTKSMLEKGAYSGLASGAGRLMDFYLKLADQVFPVIEIEAGRKVDIVLNDKIELTPLEEKQP